jgi:hypothetical protein
MPDELLTGMLAGCPPISDLRSLSQGGDPAGTRDPGSFNRVADPKEKPRPKRPTRAKTEVERVQENEAGARLIAKIVREVLAKQKFENPSKLREAVEDRCDALRLRYTRDLIERAFDLVGSNTNLLAGLLTPKRPPVNPSPEPPPLKHADAQAILDRLGIDVSGGRVRRARADSRLVPM